MKALHPVMSGALRHRLRTAAVVLALAMLAAAADAATPSKATVVLRGSQPAAAPATPATTQPAPLSFDPAIGPPPATDFSPVPRFQDDPAPRFSVDPAPRVGGLDILGGGAQCRTACAQTRYQCRVTDDLDVCDTTWGRCVASCAEVSAGRL